MNKLELNYIQHYPIGGDNTLKVQIETEQISNIKGKVVGFKTFTNSDTLVYVQTTVDTYSLYLDEFKPILRPMSDLFREIDGKIGIVELAKITLSSPFERNCLVESYQIQEGHQSLKFTILGNDYIFSLSLDKGFSFELWKDSGEWLEINQFALFEYLFENHYDVYGLIYKRLAKDKNTIQY